MLQLPLCCTLVCLMELVGTQASSEVLQVKSSGQRLASSLQRGTQMPGGTLLFAQHTYWPGQSPLQGMPSGSMIGPTPVPVPLPPTALPLPAKMGEEPEKLESVPPELLPPLPVVPSLGIPGMKSGGGSP